MNSRRKFIKQTLASGIGMSMGGVSQASHVPEQQHKPTIKLPDTSAITSAPPDTPFAPRRVARWWTSLETLQWSQKHTRDQIKRRAEAFADARIDMAIHGGCHIRFDFSNYFGQLHGYMAEVCEELHKHGIKFMEHYSCNHVHRPRGEEDFHKLHRSHRHHVLLFHDSVAAKYAEYEGYKFQDLCEVNIKDGSRGYSLQYQMEAFCHNNPGFLDMHIKYLKRLLHEVPFDAIEIDDLFDYVGLAACGCYYCRERFKRDYNREIPPLNNKSFWGDTSKPMLQWGNYENPAFRDFIQMKTDGIVDHLKLVKYTVGNMPVMTCTSSTGPIALNSLSLDLEKMAPYLDFFMLENVGININSVHWISKDAEALHQKDIAFQRGNAPSIALSSTIYETGGYLGWALSRFWGVANWSNLLNQRLVENPPDAMEMEDVIQRWNNWEIKYSDLDIREGEDLVEVRLASNRYCRDNGWRDENGKEHWDRLRAWSTLLVKHNVGYRFSRAVELANPDALLRDKSPLILDGVACVSDKQYRALSTYLMKGGKVWLALPYGTHDEKGFTRATPLHEELVKLHKRSIVLIDSTLNGDPLEKLIQSGQFHPVITLIGGDKRWAIRLRRHDSKLVFHFLNGALQAIPHPYIKDNRNMPVLHDIDSFITDNELTLRLI